jgi:DNA-3-methyladenine glycosylase II
VKKLLIDKEKLRALEPAKNAFAMLVRSIINQQISGKAAASILKKFIALWSKRNATTRFPKPEEVLAANDELLRSAGLSRGKVVYLKDLAAKFLDGTINPKLFPKMTDAEIIEHLTRVKGIGVWTAHMFLIFALNRPDILPVGDLAIRKGFMKAFGLRTMPTETKMVALAKEHVGNRTYLALHLWKLVDDGEGEW